MISYIFFNFEFSVLLSFFAAFILSHLQQLRIHRQLLFQEITNQQNNFAQRLQHKLCELQRLSMSCNYASALFSPAYLQENEHEPELQYKYQKTLTRLV